AEPNIHAGVRYLRHLYDREVNYRGLDVHNRTLFAFAAYNAGPGRVAQLRAEARRTGLDPNVWFNNVERVAALRVGQQTVTDVRPQHLHILRGLQAPGRDARGAQGGAAAAPGGGEGDLGRSRKPCVSPPSRCRWECSAPAQAKSRPPTRATSRESTSTSPRRS